MACAHLLPGVTLGCARLKRYKLKFMKRFIDASRIELLDPAMVEVLKSKTPTERLAMVFAANRTMRLRLEGHLRTYHPNWTDEQIQQEIAKRMLGGTTGSGPQNH